MYKTYDIIYSLGERCGTALYLIHFGLRLTAGPFDWIASGSFESRCDLILNNFKGFISLEDLKFKAKDPAIISDHRYDYYVNSKNGFLHYHDFAIGIPLSISFSHVLSKYDRRIGRFYRNMRTKRKILLVWFSHVTDTPDDVIIKSCNQICNYFNKTIDFLIIEHMENQHTPIRTDLAQNIVKYRLHTIKIDETGEPITTGNVELCKTLFQDLRIHRPLKLRVARWIKKLRTRKNAIR